MSDENDRLEPLLHPDHPRPVTRRQFLSQGMIGGVGVLAMPSLLGFIASRNAFAAPASCGGGLGGAQRIPFICFDLAGGASIAGSNVLVGGVGGQLDTLSQSGYIKQGLPANRQPTDPAFIDQELGIAFHSESAMLDGIRLRTEDTTLAQAEGVVLCARSENDTGNNPHNPMHGIAASGSDGELATLIGTRNSMTGGRSIAPMAMYDPSIVPVKVDRPSDAVGMVDTGQLVTLLPDPNDSGAVMRTIEEISRQKLLTIDEDILIEDLVECGYIQSSDLVVNFANPTTALDPRQDADITDPTIPIFTAAEIDANSNYRKTASVMKMVLNGYAGAGTIEMGGYDYHDSTRSTGERRDRTAGECIGAVLEYAARLQQQVMIYVFSDGSVSSNGVIDSSVDGADKGIWRSDNSSTSSSLILVYNPPIVGPRPTLTPQIVDHQIGHFRSNGSLETAATPISANVDLLAEAVVLNYLALHDEIASFDSVLPNAGLVAGQRAALTAFNNIR